MTNHKMGALYIGSTSNLFLRAEQHRQKIFENSFTAKYGLDKLVYYEPFESLESMVKRERELKKWNRNWKIKLIVDMNPNWDDLYQEFLDETIPAEYWTPECANMTRAEIKEFNRKRRGSV